MTTPSELRAYHATQAALARKLYVASLIAANSAGDWQSAQQQARDQVLATLEATKNLISIGEALTASGSHTLVLRHLLAPPMSQDQFSLLCSDYPKRSEKSGKPLSQSAAIAVEAIFHTGRDRHLTTWLDSGAAPAKSQIDTLVATLVPMMSQQTAATVRRNRLSSEQEGAVVSLLKARGWDQQASLLIESLSAVSPRHFMHKTKFATKNRPQEVDVACGLGKTVVLAMECKVTNDETNSVKRINDVLKKASAWHDHWGSFVQTAAMLQGVIAVKDVNRLLDAGVHVFWSHDLERFETWLETSLT